MHKFPQKTRSRHRDRVELSPPGALAVVADGLGGALLYGVAAGLLFFLVLRLLVDEGETLVLIAFEVVRSGLAANNVTLTRKQQAKHYGQLWNDMEFDNLAKKQQSLMQAMSMLTTIRNSDQQLGYNRETRDLELALQREMMRNNQKAMSQSAYMGLGSSLLSNPWIGQGEGKKSISPLQWLFNFIF